jgi:hypothetical protein
MSRNNLLLFVFSLLLAISAIGQAVFGNITGTITDPAGAVVPAVLSSEVLQIAAENEGLAGLRVAKQQRGPRGLG